MPLLITHSTADATIPFAASVAESARRCSQGETVQFVQLPGGNHADSLFKTETLTVGWINDRFAGKPVPSTC